MNKLGFALITLTPLAACDTGLDTGGWEAGRAGQAAAVARDSWVIAEIESKNAGLSVADRTAKYCKMAQSPFVFYRGTNHLFWHDLAGDPRFWDFGGDPTTRIWLQGDLHAYNYGSYDNDAGTIVYDLNDFDEVVIADYQWDVWRMATSIALIADENAVFSGSQVNAFMDSFAEMYLDTMASYRGNDGEIGKTFTSSNTYGLLDDFLIDVENNESRTKMLDKWTDLQNGVRAFDLTHPDLAAADPAIAAEIRAAWPDYVATTAGNLANTPGYFAIKDIAARLNAGTGSLGTPRYYVLIEGATTGQNNDRILDVKRQGAPTGYDYVSAAERAQLDSAILNHAERTIVGYRALVTDADDHLGWLALSGGVHSVRERSPYKDSFATESLDTDVRFTKLAEQWGAILATNHARADKDFRADVINHSLDKEVDIMTDGWHSEFRALTREVAGEYSQQVQLDFAAFAGYVAGQYTCP